MASRKTPASARCELAIIDRARRRARLDRARVQRVLDAALAARRLRACSLSVLLVDDDESARLHAQHFQDPTATDVMTFPDGGTDPETGLRHLGDLAVGVEVARREAATRRRRVGDELILYVLHGLLHLIGFDDVTPAQQRRMWAEQRRLLAAEGIPLEAEPG
jgi:probable rRNA maturation factor